ncbi:SMODS domain-containing nucleotidyltransferase [Kocuria sp. KH4]
MASAFEEALGHIEPTKSDKSQAAQAHLDIRDVMNQDQKLREWGINPVLIGSYRRQVAIRRIKDVDVFCRLDTVPENVTGRQALNHFSKVIKAHYGEDAVTPQARSLNVEVATWGGLHVDIVPARPGDKYWEIPDKGDPASGWQETNPEELTACSTAMNKELADMYVPLVKLVRQTRRALGIKRPGGLYVETALYKACQEGRVDGITLRELYISALRGLADVTREKVDQNIEIPDPTRPIEKLFFRATDFQWTSARDRLEEAATRAEKTRDQERCKAEVAFRELLGQNSDGDWVYPLPSDCNEDGTSKSRVYVGDRSGSKEPQRYA